MTPSNNDSLRFSTQLLVPRLRWRLAPTLAVHEIQELPGDLWTLDRRHLRHLHASADVQQDKGVWTLVADALVAMNCLLGISNVMCDDSSTGPPRVRQFSHFGAPRSTSILFIE